MNVGELKKALQKFDDDLEIVYSGGLDYCYGLVDVKTEEWPNVWNGVGYQPMPMNFVSMEFDDMAVASMNYR